MEMTRRRSDVGVTPADWTDGHTQEGATGRKGRKRKHAELGVGGGLRVERRLRPSLASQGRSSCIRGVRGGSRGWTGWMSDDRQWDCLVAPV